MEDTKPIILEDSRFLIEWYENTLKISDKDEDYKSYVAIGYFADCTEEQIIEYAHRYVDGD